MTNLSRSSQAVVYVIDDLTGGLELSHIIELSAKDFPGSPGYVREMKWTPDGCAVMLSWSKGGISLWSTFGTMLMCSLGWDYGLHVDLSTKNPLDIICMVRTSYTSAWSKPFKFVFRLHRIGQQKGISCTCCGSKRFTVMMMKPHQLKPSRTQWKRVTRKWPKNLR